MPALVEEFAETSLEEIDYLHEAASAERFAANFDGDDRASAPRDRLGAHDPPRAHPAGRHGDQDQRRRRALRAAGIDPAEVAIAFAAVMFDQIFRDGFFHADPHPGNIFVTPRAGAAEGERAWSFTFIDFGMMGEVPRDAAQRPAHADHRRRRTRRQAASSTASARSACCCRAPTPRELERAMTTLFARFGGMGFAELQQVDPREFRAFAIEFGDVVRSLPFQLPENFLLLIRAMSLTSGMCSSLDPAFNIWDAVEPYAGQLLRDEGGGVVRDFAAEAVAVAGTLARLPGRLDDLLTRVDEGRITVENPALERRVTRLERTGRRLVSAVLFAALLIGGILLRADDVVFGTVLMVVSVLPALHALLGRPLRRAWAALNDPVGIHGRMGS